MTGPAGRHYLDHNAAAPLRPAVAEAVRRAEALGGNASSLHAEGRAARALVEDAREAVAALVGADPERIVFTSGGTEAVATLLSPEVRSRAGDRVRHLLVGATDHSCVLAGGRFRPGHVEALPVDGAGLVRVDALAAALEATGPCLVALGLANNETGVLQPLAEVAGRVRRAGGVLVADAVQALGRVPLDVDDLGVDALALSAHKAGGPKGVGAIVFGRDAPDFGPGLVRGGGQERGLRGGTENVAAIAGFGTLARDLAGTLAEEARRLAGLRGALEARIRALAPEAIVFGAGVPRLPNTLLFAAPGVAAEDLLMRLDLAGVAVSSGSACASGVVGRSHVLAAMGVPAALAAGAIRLSLGWSSTMRDVTGFAGAFASAVQCLSVVHDRGAARAA